MTRTVVLSRRRPHAYRPIALKLACMIALFLYAAAVFGQTPGGTVPIGEFRFTITHILGLGTAPANAKGTLWIQDNAVVFHRGNTTAQVPLSSIRDLRLGESDKQVGGVPMKVGKMAVPYGGGRVISLFAHKKYDTLTVEYVDANGGFHGAILQLEKDKAHVLRNELLNRGAHVPETAEQAAQQSTPTPVLTAGVSSENAASGSAEWSVVVDRVGTGNVNIEPAFTIAIYENLVHELDNKKNGFKDVFRDGDHNANDVSNLLILKTTVEKYTAGSETRRAVTTVSGATKVSVRSQLCTRDGRVVVERVLEGKVRFLGGNLQATNNLARNVAKNLKPSTLNKTPLSAADLRIDSKTVLVVPVDPTIVQGLVHGH